MTPHYNTPDVETGETGPIGFQRRGKRGSLVDVDQCKIATDAINARLISLRSEVRAQVKEKAEQKRAGQLEGRVRGATLLVRDANGVVVTDHHAEVTEEVHGFKFTFKAGEFFQNNPFVLPKMVSYVTEEAARGGNLKYLMDVYCGGGLFCICSSERFEQCLGIEISDQNIQSAKRNAEANGLTNCEFHSGTAEAIFGQVLVYDPTQTAVIIDPPRKGCSDEFLDQLFEFRPARVVYVSCDPATQARDAAKMVAAGYKITRVTPFDLFPQTRHIENVMTFEL